MRGLEPQRGLGLICLFTSSPRSFQSSLLWQTRTPKRRRVCTRVIWSGLINKSAYSFSLNTTIITFLRSVKRQQTSKDGAEQCQEDEPCGRLRRSCSCPLSLALSFETLASQPPASPSRLDATKFHFDVLVDDSCAVKWPIFFCCLTGELRVFTSQIKSCRQGRIISFLQSRHFNRVFFFYSSGSGWEYYG